MQTEMVIGGLTRADKQQVWEKIFDVAVRGGSTIDSASFLNIKDTGWHWLIKLQHPESKEANIRSLFALVFPTNLFYLIGTSIDHH